MFKATGMQMCVSRLTMPAVDFKTAFKAVPHIDSTVNSQLPLALKLLVGNSTSWKMLLQALQAWGGQLPWGGQFDNCRKTTRVGEYYYRAVSKE